jgi:hypothetical protein
MHNTSAMAMLPWASFVIATIWLLANLHFFIKPSVVNAAVNNRKVYFQKHYFYGGIAYHIRKYSLKNNN